MSRLLDALVVPLEFLAVLGVVVSFHELGHFLAAKLLRVKVDVFSIGFGPRLFGRKVGETDYRISILPLGGYVLMAGDLNEEDRGEDEAAGLARSSRPRDPRDFDARPFPARLAIMLAGPVFSALLTVLLMWGLFVTGVQLPAFLSEPPRIGPVAAGSPAEAAGLRKGDRVVSVDGKPMDTWERFQELVLVSPKARLQVGIERGGVPMTLPVDVGVTQKHRIGDIGAEACATVIVQGVEKGSPAAAAGILPGDVIAEVGGEETCWDTVLTSKVQAAAGAPLPITLLRDGRRIEVSPSARKDPKATARPWRIGVYPGYPTSMQRYPPLRALRESLRDTGQKASLVLVTLGKLATGQLSFRAVSGPLEMMTITGETAQAGFKAVVQLVALFSINLAVLNLLPIPILDGGRILVLSIEAARGRDLQRRTKEWILQAGLAMIVVLMVVVLVLDVLKRSASDVADVAPAGAGDVAPAGAGDVAPAGAGDVAPAGAGDVAPTGAGDVAPAGATGGQP